LRLRDILSAVEETFDFTLGMTKAEFCENLPAVKAVMMNLVIIGEATTNLPDEVQWNYPDVPWQNLKKMRNVAPMYFCVDLDIVWKAIQHGLPLLMPQLRTILDDLER